MTDTSDVKDAVIPSDDDVDASAVKSEVKAEDHAVVTTNTKIDTSADVPSDKVGTNDLSKIEESKQEDEKASIKDSESEKKIKDDVAECEKPAVDQPAPAPQVTATTSLSATDNTERPSIVKASSSHDLVFETKRKRRKVDLDPNCHTVTFTVNIAMAVPTDDGRRRRRFGSHKKVIKNKKVYQVGFSFKQMAALIQETSFSYYFEAEEISNGYDLAEELNTAWLCCC